MGREIGRRVREIRAERGWSMRQLGEKIGASHSYISQLEHGLIAEIGTERLGALAQALGISAYKLVGVDGLSAEAEEERDLTAIGLVNEIPASTYLIAEALEQYGDTVPGEEVAEVVQNFMALSAEGRQKALDELRWLKGHSRRRLTEEGEEGYEAGAS